MFKRPFVLLLIFVCLAAAVLAQAKLDYPQAKRGDQVDDYFGIKVADPYRWLENNDSQEVADWVEAENKVTSH